MTKIKYNIDAMKFMSMFESLTRTKLKDCIISESMLTFVVEEGEIAKAIGKNASNVRLLEKKLKKKIKIAEYSTDLAKFLENLSYPAKIDEIEITEGIAKIKAVDSQSRGMMIGRDANILRANEAIVKRYFDIKEIKIL